MASVSNDSSDSNAICLTEDDIPGGSLPGNGFLWMKTRGVKKTQNLNSG